jgi:hypothetical protein
MRILLATDAWTPQVNGVVRTWQHVIRELESMGHEVVVAHPGLGRTIAARATTRFDWRCDPCAS